MILEVSYRKKKNSMQYFTSHSCSKSWFLLLNHMFFYYWFTELQSIKELCKDARRRSTILRPPTSMHVKRQIHICKYRKGRYTHFPTKLNLRLLFEKLFILITGIDNTCSRMPSMVFPYLQIQIFIHIRQTSSLLFTSFNHMFMKSTHHFEWIAMTSSHK